MQSTVSTDVWGSGDVGGGGHVDPENLCVLVDFDHKTADINHLYIKLAKKKKLAVLATMFSIVDSEAVK